MNLEKRANSFRIWYANSRVWQRMTIETSPSTGSLRASARANKGRNEVPLTSAADRQGRRPPSYPYQTWPDTRRRCRGWPGGCTPVALRRVNTAGSVNDKETDSPSDGCSKPRSEMARSSSGFNRKSLQRRERSAADHKVGRPSHCAVTRACRVHGERRLEDIQLTESRSSGYRRMNPSCHHRLWLRWWRPRPAGRMSHRRPRRSQQALPRRVGTFCYGFFFAATCESNPRRTRRVSTTSTR
jgi:hypothetical protein